jgi:hypothetical protein
VLASEIYRVDDIHLETFDGADAAERFYVTTSPAAEAMIMADHELADSAASEQDLLHKPFRRESGQVAVKPEDKHVIKRRLG